MGNCKPQSCCSFQKNIKLPQTWQGRCRPAHLPGPQIASGHTVALRKPVGARTRRLAFPAERMHNTPCKHFTSERMTCESKGSLGQHTCS